MNFIRSLLLYAKIWRDLSRIFDEDTTGQENGVFREARCGSIKPTDAMIVAKILRQHRPLRILEIGSFLGISTRWLLDVSSPWNAKVTAVDPNIPHRIFNNPRRFVMKLTSQYGSNRLEIFSAFFGRPSKQLSEDIQVIDADWGKTFDLIFIDGDHSYEAVADNFRLSLHMLGKNGVILFHDALSWPDVTRFLSEIKEEFLESAEVSVLGTADRKLLNLIGRSNDGIGYFRLI